MQTGLSDDPINKRNTRWRNETYSDTKKKYLRNIWIFIARRKTEQQLRRV